MGTSDVVQEAPVQKNEAKPTNFKEIVKEVTLTKEILSVGGGESLSIIEPQRCQDERNCYNLGFFSPRSKALLLANACAPPHPAPLVMVILRPRD